MRGETNKPAAFVLAAIVAGVGGYYAYGWWTKPPAVEFDNLKYVQLLSTAVSARNAEWLGKVAAVVEERHASGEMSDAEQRAFARIVDLARGGEWERADRACYALAEAQLSRRRTRPPSDDHDHDHDR